MDDDLLKRLERILGELNDTVEELDPASREAILLFGPTHDLGWAWMRCLAGVATSPSGQVPRFDRSEPKGGGTTAKRKTKAEREAEERNAYEIALRGALGWPAELAPEPYSKEEVHSMAVNRHLGEEAVRAWTYNVCSKLVTHGCFTLTGHAADGTKTTSQTSGGPWFDTAAEAFIAMRWAVCRQMANELLLLEQRRPSTP